MIRPDLQTLVETIPRYVFDQEEKVGRCPTLITNFMVRITETAICRCYSK